MNLFTISSPYWPRLYPWSSPGLVFGAREGNLVLPCPGGPECDSVGKSLPPHEQHGPRKTRKKRVTPTLDPAKRAYWLETVLPSIRARHSAFEAQVKGERERGERPRKGSPTVIAAQLLADAMGVSPQKIRRALGIRRPSEPPLSPLEPFIPSPTLFDRLKMSMLATQDTGARARSGVSLLKRVDDEQLGRWQQKGLPHLRLLCEEKAITQRALAQYLGISEVVLSTVTRKAKPTRPTQGLFDKGQQLAQKLEATGGLERVVREVQDHAMGGVAVARRAASVNGVHKALGKVCPKTLPTKPEFEAFMRDATRKKWSKPRRLYTFLSDWLARNPDAVGVFPSVPDLRRLWTSPTSDAQASKRDPSHISTKEMQVALTWLAYEGKLVNRDAKIGFVRPGQKTPDVIKTLREKTSGEQAIERVRDFIALQRLSKKTEQFITEPFIVDGRELGTLSKRLSLPEEHLRTALLYWQAQGQVAITRASARDSNRFNLTPLGAKPILPGRSNADDLRATVLAYETTPLAQPRGFVALIADSLQADVEAAQSGSLFKVSMPEVSRRFLVTTATARQAMDETLRRLDAPDSPVKGRYRVRQEAKGVRNRPTWILEAIPWAELPRS